MKLPVEPLVLALLLTPLTAQEPGEGPAHLERALDLLARVDFSLDEPLATPSVAPARCVLVGVHARAGFADVFAVGAGARMETVDGDGAVGIKPFGRRRPGGGSAGAAA